MGQRVICHACGLQLQDRNAVLDEAHQVIETLAEEETMSEGRGYDALRRAADAVLALKVDPDAGRQTPRS
jgi:hypothetical protein